MSGFEVIGAIAAAGQFIEQSSKVTKLCKGIHENYREAPAEIKTYLEELQVLERVADSIRADPYLQTQEAETTLRRCTEIMTELEQILNNLVFSNSDRPGKKLWRAARYLTEETFIRKLLDDLERQKLSLLLQLSASKAAADGLQFKTVREEISRLRHDSILSVDAESCMRALFLVDPSNSREDLVTRKGHIVPGTSEWILSTSQYQDWLTSASNCLWISGGPGMGKTMLSIFITQQLEEYVKLQDEGAAVTYFFCQHQDNKLNTAMSILRGILYRLFQTHPALLDHILTKYKIQMSALFQDSSFESLWMSFREICLSETTPRIYCVIDGLDECEQGAIHLLLRKIEDIVNETGSTDRLRLLIVSREYPTSIGDALRAALRIRLDPDSKNEVNNGLKLYLKAKVDKLASRKGGQYTAELRELVMKTLQIRSQGTYLWVSFVINDLAGKSPSEVEETLQDLPPGLDGIYERLLAEIPEARRHHVRTALVWIAFAERPLNLAELANALSLEPSKTLDKIGILKDQLDYCGHLVSVTENGIVNLVHQSIHDFLVRQQSSGAQRRCFPPIAPNEAHRLIAEKCLSSLRVSFVTNPNAEEAREDMIKFGKDRDEKFWLFQQACCVANPSAKEGRDDTTEYNDEITGEDGDGEEFWHQYVGQKHDALLDYALQWWPSHVRQSGPLSRDIWTAQCDIFEGHPVLLNLWWSIYGSIRYRGPSKVPQSLHLAIILGLSHVIEMKTSRRRDKVIPKSRRIVNARDGDGWTPLQMAALGDNLPALQLLLSLGANPNSSNDNENRPINIAVKKRNVEAVKLLLKHGSISDLRYWTVPALRDAMANGNEEIARVLMEDKIIKRVFSSIDEIKAFLVRPAVAGGSVAILKMLDVDWNLGSIRKSLVDGPLPWYLERGFNHPEVTSYMIEEWGLNVDAQDSVGWTPLMNAVLGYSMRVVKMLVEVYKADVNMTSWDGRTALHLIFVTGRSVRREMMKYGIRGLAIADIVRCIMENGADLQIRDCEGKTAEDYAREDAEEFKEWSKALSQCKNIGAAGQSSLLLD